MAQTNYTPISLYYSTTASAVPTAANLVQGELAINTNDGKLYLTDKSDPDRIREEVGMSKKTFKAAVGILYKLRMIQLKEDHIAIQK